MKALRRVLVACIMALASVIPVGASPFLQDILSGSTWLSATDPTLVGNIGDSTSPGGWTTVGFNDSAWVHAVAVPNSVIIPQTVVPGTAAQFMWSPQGIQGPPTGSNGLPDAFFRFDFNLPPTANLPLLGQAKIIADDRFDLFVNGQFVKAATLAFHMDPTDPTQTRPLPVLVNFTDNLHFGENVIAIRGRDGFPGSNVDPGDPFRATTRGNQFVFFDGTVSTAVPEPAAILLLGTGLVALFGLRWEEILNANFKNKST